MVKTATEFVHCSAMLLPESSVVVNRLACLEVRGGLGQLDDALHAAGQALGAELRQDDGQNGIMVAGQKVVIHTLTCKLEAWRLLHFCRLWAPAASLNKHVSKQCCAVLAQCKQMGCDTG